jgi:hypothetical protein
MLKKILIAFVMTMVAATAHARVIDTQGKYHVYNILHKKRVYVLGDFVLFNNPDAFPDLVNELSAVHEGLWEHDDEKFVPEIEDLLYSIYGVKINTPQLAARREYIVGRLNNGDKVRLHAFFDRHKWLNPDGTYKPAAEQFIRLVNIVDYIDRVKNWLSPEEFARDIYPLAEHPDLNPTDLEIGNKTALRYGIIVRGYSYPEVDEGDIDCALAMQRQLLLPLIPRATH